MVKLSIIIPHYNSVVSLKKLLYTIPFTEEIEIILVDDKSDIAKDELKSLVNDFQKRNLVFLENKTEVKGAGVCRNIGLKVANGEWVLFADADDFFLDNFYQVVEEYIDSKLDVVFFSPTSVEMDTGKESNRHTDYAGLIQKYIEKSDLYNELSLRYRFFVPWSKLIRRSFLFDNKIYFDEVIASNDVMFSTKTGFYMDRFLVSESVIYCVTSSRGSLTTTVNEKIYNIRLEVFINYYKFLKSHLNRQEFDTLNVKGTEQIITAIESGFNFKKVFKIFLKLKRNKIKIFDIQYLNLKLVITKLKKRHHIYKKRKKYFSM